MNINGWRSMGFAFANNVSLSSGSYVVATCTQDTTNAARSGSVPDTCNLFAIEVNLTGNAAWTSADTVQVYLARDSARNFPITPGETSGATQDVTVGSTTTAGGTVFITDIDYKHDAGVANTTSGTIYVALKLTLDSGSSISSATADVRVHYRA
jgi:hypothetical protein